MATLSPSPSPLQIQSPSVGYFSLPLQCYKPVLSGDEDPMDCLYLYVPGFFFLVGVLLLFISCFLRCCSKEEKEKRRNKEYLKAKSSRGVLELPRWSSKSDASKDRTSSVVRTIGSNPMRAAKKDAYFIDD